MIFEKINFSKIIVSHLRTLQNANTKKAGLGDYVTFLVTPLVFALFLTWAKVPLKNDAINIIITTLSIFVGLMFNIIVLIFDIVKRDARQHVKNEVLKQLLANISFEILISVFSILSTLGTFFENSYLKIAFSFITYFSLAVFLLTLLMILKRMYNVFKNEIDELEKSSKSEVDSKSSVF